MLFNPLVSIIIPVYNGSNYLKDAIDSALNQTYSNIEVIVVNDGSNDNGETEKIALEYGSKIKYFSKSNGHVASALNYGIDRMRGSYFSWLSHDDLYHVDKIAEQLNILHSLDNKCTIIYSPYELIDEKSKYISTVNPADQLDEYQLNTSLAPLFRGLLHGCSLLIPAILFKEIGKFNESLRVTQDYMLWFDFLRKTPIFFCKKPLVQSRIHPNQDSKKVLTVNEECNSLWIKLLDSVTLQEMLETEGSKYAFYRRAFIFLSTTPYTDAKEYANKLSDLEFEKTKVSIVIPVYNKINYAIEAVDSVLKQTHKNIEVLVIDDYSDEDISCLVSKCNTDSRIKFFKMDSNKGASYVRNFGIAQSTGDYIAFLDADDLFLPQKIEIQLRKMIEDDCYISHTSYQTISFKGVNIETIKSGKLTGKVFPSIISMCPIATPTVIVSRKILKNNKFNINYNYGEDIILWLDLLNGRKLSGVINPLSIVRKDNNSASNNSIKQIKGLINITTSVLNNPKHIHYIQNVKPLLDTASGLIKKNYQIVNSNINVLQIGHSDLYGKEFNGYMLNEYLRNKKGWAAHQLVAQKHSNNSNVSEIYVPFKKIYQKLAHYNSVQAKYYPTQIYMRFNKHVRSADLLHFHILEEGRSFNIDALPYLTNKIPSVWSLHDPWALTGHCVTPIGCDRWKEGCITCDKLDLYPAIKKDNANYMWKRKQHIYRKSSIDIVVASQLMLDYVKNSPLMSNFRIHKINFGVDLSIFNNTKNDNLSKKLHYTIPKNHVVILFRYQPGEMKGFKYIIDALKLLKTSVPVTVVSLGHHDDKCELKDIEDKYNHIGIPWIDEPAFLAEIYKQADIFLSPSIAENFGMMAAEAMACGCVVVGFDGKNTNLPNTIFHKEDGGVIVPERDTDALAQALKILIENPEKRYAISRNASKLASIHYNINDYYENMVNLYQEVVARRRCENNT